MDLDFDSVSIGDTLPDFHVVPTLQGAVMYCAAMWEFQRIHYDHEWAKTQENLERAVIQGPVLGNYLAQAVARWTGPGGRLARLTWRNHGVALLDTPLVCKGRVMAKRDRDADAGASAGRVGTGVIDCELDIHDAGGRRILSGSASVAVPRQEGSWP